MAKEREEGQEPEDERTPDEGRKPGEGGKPEEEKKESTHSPAPSGDADRVRKIHYSEDTAREMLETAIYQDQADHAASQIATMALGEMPVLCPDCGLFCHHQVVALRDKFCGRALVLASELIKALDLYFRCREFGITEPFQILNDMYQVWAELSILHDMSEPQERAAPQELPPDPYGDDPFADGDEGE